MTSVTLARQRSAAAKGSEFTTLCDDLRRKMQSDAYEDRKGKLHYDEDSFYMCERASIVWKCRTRILAKDCSRMIPLCCDVMTVVSRYI